MKIPNAYYLIIDLEATCASDGSVPREEMEIIEIGAVMQNARTLEVESEFQTFICPMRHPVLTPFCTQLTTITQGQVASAPLFPEALEILVRWSASFEDALFCSWGNYDATQFRQDCSCHGVPYPFLGHMNLKEAFAAQLGLRRKLGLGEALRRLGLEFEGTAHRGIDDARNMARIVRHLSSQTA